MAALPFAKSVAAPLQERRRDGAPIRHHERQPVEQHVAGTLGRRPRSPAGLARHVVQAAQPGERTSEQSGAPRVGRGLAAAWGPGVRGSAPRQAAGAARRCRDAVRTPPCRARAGVDHAAARPTDRLRPSPTRRERARMPRRSSPFARRLRRRSVRSWRDQPTGRPNAGGTRWQTASPPLAWALPAER